MRLVFLNGILQIEGEDYFLITDINEPKLRFKKTEELSKDLIMGTLSDYKVADIDIKNDIRREYCLRERDLI